ncbi:MAG: CRISPR system precrRNA processing endoribonuclease RAMP protein Cas6 [Geobacteraceae bacterium]|nr:CRISPR system precrRNA processing endoribonuclease RAMP protein Cas6 [Geobacteraceae bacterium]
MLTQHNPLIPLLLQAEFAQLHFECRMGESVHIDISTILRLRRRLRTAAQEILRDREGVFKPLFEPPLSTDPVALKRYQKGAPAFVLVPMSIRQGDYRAGELFTFEVRLFGNIAELAPGLIEVFAALGKTGLRLDAGKYTLKCVFASDAGEDRIPVWHESGGNQLHNIPRLDLGWWLGGQPQACDLLELKFITPARILTHGRPLFNPDLGQLFPFVLRRVTAMLYIHCGVELDPVDFELAYEINGWSCEDNNLHWYDWRYLHAESGRSKPLGGICGTLRVQGDVTGPMLSMLQLGSLLNLGKNAAYGVGAYSIEYMNPESIKQNLFLGEIAYEKNCVGRA